MKLQRLLSYVRRACDDYDMLHEGDRIAVGVSGGKDSLTLLAALAHLRRFYPKHFTIEAITVSLGLPGEDFSDVQRYCDELNVRYTIVKTDIGEIVFDIRKESNPCSLCAKMRKAALNTKAKELGCNKIAYGHSKDDVVHTFFMSLFFESRINTFRPVTYLDRMDLTLIRPLIYAPENEIQSFVKHIGVQVVKSPCPAAGYTKREEMKDFVKAQMKKYRDFDNTVFSAITRSEIPGWKAK